MTDTNLTPDLYSLYRRARFGNAGTKGKDGVAKCAKHHGVTVRAWLYYESGRMSPKLGQRQKVARWLSAQEKALVAVTELESYTGAKEPATEV
jgi:hypothetical protein